MERTMLEIEAPLRVSRELFVALVEQNPEARLERARDGTLIQVPPCGYDGASRNGEVFGQLWAWNRGSGAGTVTGPDGGFELPDTAIRAPDAAWVSRKRSESLKETQRRTFAPLCPDFVVEVRSPSDRVSVLHEKMAEYVENGARLGWLIDPYTKTVEIYRAGRDPEILVSPEALSGEGVLDGFVLHLGPIFAD